MIHTLDGDQYLLNLRMPWNGYDPRSLTRGSRIFSLASEGTGRVNMDESEGAQLELFPEGIPYGS